MDSKRATHGFVCCSWIRVAFVDSNVCVDLQLVSARSEEVEGEVGVHGVGNHLVICSAPAIAKVAKCG